MNTDTTRVILRHATSGDVYVADTDGYTGEVYSAVGPLHYSEVAAAFDDPEWDAELPGWLNTMTDQLRPITLEEASGS